MTATARADGLIRLVLVDDQRAEETNIQAHIESNEACGISFVERFKNNAPDLADLVAAANPDVVLVDLILGGRLRHPDAGPDELNGIKACTAIRRKVRRPTKIVAYSQFPELRGDVLARGADAFFEKGVTPDLFDFIRNVHAGTPPDEARPIEAVSLLKLVPAELRVRIEFVGQDKPVGFVLEPAAYALLWYSVRERLDQARDWLVFDEKCEKSTWRIGNRTAWAEINERCGTGHVNDTHLESEFLIQCRTKVHRELKEHHEMKLLTVARADGVPAVGRPKTGQVRIACLREDITKDVITIV
jgi:DNA-binding NarL/FixJ family response regulator